MTTPDLLPCTPYSTPDEMRTCPPFDNEELYPDSLLESALEVASRVMYLATGRIFQGTCTVTSLRPCGCSHCMVGQDMGWGYIIWPGMRRWYVGGSWSWGRTWTCGGRCGGASCSCPPLHQVQLGVEPLATVTAVRIDGVTLDPTAYRVDEWKWLVRLDGEHWPRCQNMAAANGAEGSWEVDLTWGLPPSSLVVKGTEALAGEMAKACVPGSDCQLPSRMIESLSRNGLQVGFIDPMEFLTSTPPRTGIWEADLAITMENPTGQMAPPVCVNPADYARAARRIGT